MRTPRTGALLALAFALIARAAPAAAQSPSAAPAPGCAPVSTSALPTAPSGDASPISADDLTVFAAASLTRPFADLQAPWEAAHLAKIELGEATRPSCTPRTPWAARPWRSSACPTRRTSWRPTAP